MRASESGGSLGATGLTQRRAGRSAGVSSGSVREGRQRGMVANMGHPTTMLSAMRLPVGAQQQRRVGLAQALRRLEREHVALLLAMCELEAEQAAAKTQATQGATPASARDSLRAALAPMLREDLRRAQYALARAAQGQYGVCERCGRPIALRRLQLQISATCCEGCATRAH
ncbi:MAG TPA: hypothetical protein VMV29_09320 [Ktedonobacterales bacterium]|nr:hypothetical protein [Ktedonobacterales bacterium]